MKKTIRIVSLLAMLIFVAVSGCTNFREEEMPVSLGVDVNIVDFAAAPSTRYITVTSGSKWEVSSMPSWIRLQSIERSGRSPYEWTVNFAAAANDEYNREGIITFKANTETAEVSVTQEGKKGKYVAVESVSVSPTELTLTEGENALLSYVISPSNASIKDVKWKTSSSSVATVSETGRVDAVGVGTALITVTTDDGNKTASCSVTVKPIIVSSVSLDKESLTLKIGENSTLIAMVLPVNAANKKVTWSSSNNSVATVDSNGKVTGIGVGSAKITVTTEDGGKTASCAVTVNPISVTGVSLNKTSVSLVIGGTEKLTATVTPSNATNKNVIWSSSNTSVATVDSNGNVSGIKVGTAVITVKTEDGGKTATCAVTVNPISVAGVSLSQTSLIMTEGDTQTLTATISPSNATDKSVTWSSSNTSVATVSSSGVVTAKSAGNATITVTTNDGGKTATCAVTVKEKTVSVTGVSLDKTTLSMTEGDAYSLTATVTPSNATNKSVTWSSSSTSVATVSSSGVVTAKAAGSATITVTTVDGGKTATCSVTVQAKTVTVTGVSLDKATLSMMVGDTQTLTATVTPSNATDKSVTWSSSNTSVATVSSSGVVMAKAAGSAMITVTTNDGAKKATCSVTVNAATVSVTGVSLDKTSLSMTEGDIQTLIATITPSNATDKSVIWSSSNTSVATVSPSGVVTAKSAGNATITVTTNDGAKKATCSVTVKAATVAVTGVSLNKTSMSLLIGGTEKLTATVTPSNATNKNVTWSSSNTSVATVDSNGNVSGIKVGTAVITVKTEDGGKTATCAVTVNPISVTGVSLNETSLTMTIGDTQALTATVTPSNATDKSVTWSSSNTSVATVTSSGVVTAKAAGSATITVTTNDGGKKAACSVTVKAQTVPVTGVSLNKTSLTMTIGDTQTLTATVTPSNATDKSVTWSSSSTSVATVSNSGVVTATGAGSATITVTTNDGGKTATCSVTVTEATVSVTGVSLNKTSLSMTVGDTQTLTATVSPSNATNKTVTWSSSNTSVATVSSGGVVTGVGAGTATITVTTTDGGKTATCTVTVKPYMVTTPEAIDLGLSVKWASFNLGASKPEEYGDYFAWGETEPKANYSWTTYKWCMGSENTMTKYCSNSKYGHHGFTDTKTILDLEDDAAHANLGGSWRMPTDAEWGELINNCTWTWTTQNGVNGYLISASNGNSIFLTAAGLRNDASLYYEGSNGYYWSSSLFTDPPYGACLVRFYSDNVLRYSDYRCRGFSVRPVYGERKTSPGGDIEGTEKDPWN